MANTAGKIEAKDKSLCSIFSENRYRIDVFQREYRWQSKQIESLLSDLASAFFASWEDGHNIEDVERYNTYYMGPVVLCKDGVECSIVDGQQRLTSFSLLFVYLQHLQGEVNVPDELKRDMREQLYIRRGGKYTFILNVKERNEIMERLLNSSDDYYKLTNGITDKANAETIENLVGRYEDINRLFPQELKDPRVLPLFIEWLLYEVIFVEVMAYSVDNAYTIFETMNDRGLSLNPTEILKAFILSKINDDERSENLNDYWKNKIATIKYKTGGDGDLTFFRSWFRAKYAVTVRNNNAGAGKEDFEEIGSQYHSWFKTNIKKIGIKDSMDYYYFVKSDMDFFANAYIDITSNSSHESMKEYNPLYITNCYPMADSLYLPLMMSSLNVSDSQEIVRSKIIMVNQFVDKFINLRSIAFKSINQSSIRYFIYDLVKKIRSTTIEELHNVLDDCLKRLDNEEYRLSSIQGYTQAYMHYFFARVMYCLDSSVAFSSLLRTKRQNSYILNQVFSSEEFDSEYLASTGRNAWCISNYCLIRRYDQKNTPVALNERIPWLINKGYLPDLNVDCDISPEKFFEERYRSLSDFVKRIWNPQIVE